jgi:hypothetical protein
MDARRTRKQGATMTAAAPQFKDTLGNLWLIPGATPVPVTPPKPLEPTIPSTAFLANALTHSSWEMNHDAGTPGASTGTTSYPATAPDGTPNCRLFDFFSSGGGGEIYHFPLLSDCTPYSNFCFTVRRMTPNPTLITCWEHDLEACDASGNPLDMATQEDSYNKTFDITANHKWVGTGINVVPTAWAANSWHEDKVYLIDNKNGTVTYVGVNLDGVWYYLGITVADVDASKWAAKILNIQLQFDVVSKAVSTEAKAYMSLCQVECW